MSGLTLSSGGYIASSSRNLHSAARRVVTTGPVASSRLSEEPGSRRSVLTALGLLGDVPYITTLTQMTPAPIDLAR